MIGLPVAIDVALCIWLIFFGGAKKIEDKWVTIIEGTPFLSEDELRLFAWANLIAVAGFYVFKFIGWLS